MNLREIQEISGGILKGSDVTFNSVSIDTRTMQPGALFVAIKGERFNGNEFVEEAAKKQAAAAIVSESLEVELPTLQVEDSRLALGLLARRNRELCKARIIALTGSQGKTTVKEMTAAILQHCGKVLKTAGNLNNDYGVPLTLLNLEAGHQFAVIELGANAPGEISYTSALVRPEVAHITNIAPTHLEGFGDLDGVARAKSEIWENMAPEGVAVINLDDAYGGYWMEQLKGRKLVCISALGKAMADFRVSDLQFGEGMQSRFTLNTPEGSIAIRLNLPGQHNVANALAAAALSIQAGAELEDVRQGLEDMQSVSGRMQNLKGPNASILINDAYNASPSSFRAAIDVLAAQPGIRIVAMGDMAELGKEQEEAHREIGRYAAEKGIDMLLATGPMSGLAVESFGAGSRHFTGLEELAADLLPRLGSDVTVLIKGSRSAGMDRLVQLLQEQQGD